MRACVTTLAIAALLVAAPAVWADWPNHPGALAPVEALSTDALSPVAAADGAGGAIVVWVDVRAGNTDIYAQRIDSRGNTMWTSGGVPVCVAAGGQTTPTVMADAAGNAIVAWTDNRTGTQRDIYAMRLLASGAPDPAWPVNGRLLSSTLRDESGPTLASDGAGGAYVGYDRIFTLPDIDPYVTRVFANGTVGATLVGTALSQTQHKTRVVSDDAGGVYLVWVDNRSGASRLYAQHFASGAPVWTADGMSIYAPSTVSEFDACRDGAGGVFMAFMGDFAEAYVTRVLSGGAIAWARSASNAYDGPSDMHVQPDGLGGAIVAWVNAANAVAIQRFNATGSTQWTTTGIRIRDFGVQPGALSVAGNTGANEVLNVQLVADGEGGGVCSWLDFRQLGTPRVYAQRVSASGVVMWPAQGALVADAYTFTNDHTLVTDTRAGGIAVVPGGDFQSDIGSQRIGRFGNVGLPEPRIVSVRDIANDQGSFVSIRWNASYLDRLPWNPIASYRVWRQVPSAIALARVRQGAVVVRDGGPATGDTPGWQRTDAAFGSRLLETTVGQTSLFWELVGSQPASALAQYSFTAPTTGDSVAGSNPRTVFMVQAYDGGSFGYVWESAPDSGYSVDNLAPPAPAPFTAQFEGGNTLLQWGANAYSAPDFAHHEVHRGVTPGFTPGPATQIGITGETSLLHAWTQPAYYKLAAVDVHGNRSGFVSANTPGNVDAPTAGLPLHLWLAPATPNPSRGATTIRFGLPRAGQVRLEIFDAAGRRVRVIADAELEAGEHALRWDGRDETGHAVRAGLLLVRLRAEGETRIGRMTVLE